jgi:hypothetical protein
MAQKTQSIDKVCQLALADPSGVSPTPMLWPNGAGGTTDGLDFATYGGGFGGSGRWAVANVLVIITWFRDSTQNFSETWFVTIGRKSAAALVISSTRLSPDASTGKVSFDNDGSTSNFRILLDPDDAYTIAAARVIGVVTDEISDPD